MKLRVETKDKVARVYLGEWEVPGVTYLAFSAGADNPDGELLLHIKGCEVMAEIDGALLDIEATDLQELPALDLLPDIQ